MLLGGQGRRRSPLLLLLGVFVFMNLHRTRALRGFARHPFHASSKRGLGVLRAAAEANAGIREADVVVIGGGHAGCEAAAASARSGARTVLLTQRADTIGELSCNPSIGGIGKGHLVREVDALDGLMGRITDEAGIHFRMLNRRKGPAVRGPRAQADRELYRSAMQAALACTPNLSVVEGSAEDLLLAGSEGVRGVVLSDGRHIEARAVVLTTGTFLRGKCYIGDKVYWAGRHLRDSPEVEPPSIGLSETLERFGFPLARLKTGTPARLDGNTIDWGALEPQPSEYPPEPFSFLNSGVANADRLISCAKTYTNEQTHRIVMDEAHTLPGEAKHGVGPRYCPSIYKKCERFPDRDQHLSWLEPEGLNTNVVYPNGMSGPYPEETQLRIFRTMKGLEQVEIVRPGYDVEYDYVQPTSLHHTLETKQIPGLYLAGQICGTTGYEEAAGQGIIAGANAGLAVQGRSSLIIGRDEGYIGVLIDDLVTKGTSEPYRMFTSRAEYRLHLRQDNADLRLTKKGAHAGIVGREREEAVEARDLSVSLSLARLRQATHPVSMWGMAGIDLPTSGVAGSGGADGRLKTAAEVLSLPDLTLDQVEEALIRMASSDAAEVLMSSKRIARAPGDEAARRDAQTLAMEAEASLREVHSEAQLTPKDARHTVEAMCKYANYMARQTAEMENYRKSQGVRIPPDMEYTREELPPLSSEELEKLRAARPTTFAEAGVISGITPNSLVFLYHYVTKRLARKDAKRAEESDILTHHWMDEGEVAAAKGGEEAGATIQ